MTATTPATPEDVLTALELVSARVPDRHVTPDRPMAMAWAVDLAAYDRAAVLRAAREWGELRFPSSGQFVAAVQAAARAINVERSEYQAVERERGVPIVCPECDGAQQVETDASGHGTYRPCSRCNPRGFWLWTFGHWDAGHECGLCAQVRRGKVQLLDERIARQPAPDPLVAADF